MKWRDMVLKTDQDRQIADAYPEFSAALDALEDLIDVQEAVGKFWYVTELLSWGKLKGLISLPEYHEIRAWLARYFL